MTERSEKAEPALDRNAVGDDDGPIVEIAIPPSMPGACGIERGSTHLLGLEQPIIENIEKNPLMPDDEADYPSSSPLLGTKYVSGNVHGRPLTHWF